MAPSPPEARHRTQQQTTKFQGEQMIQQELALVAQVAAVYSVLALSPGANFIVISNTAIAGSRSEALAVAAGVSTASVLWSALALAGWGALFASAQRWMLGLQAVGALYLLYLAARLMVLARQPAAAPSTPGQTNGLTRRYLLGLGTNLTNPKTLIFFLSVFSTMFAGQASLTVGLACLAVIGAISMGWNALVALMFSNASLRQRYLKLKPIVDTAAGAILAYFGFRLLLPLLERFVT